MASTVQQCIWVMKTVTQEWEELPGKARRICSWALELRRSLPDFPGKEEHFRQKKSTDRKWWWFDLLGNGVVRGETKETDTVEHPLFITQRKRSQSGGWRGKKNQPSLWDPERQSTVTQLADSPVRGLPFWRENISQETVWQIQMWHKSILQLRSSMKKRECSQLQMCPEKLLI